LIKRLASTDADFKARLDALLAFEAAQDDGSNRRSPPSWPT
jgi:histidinol dehydrogenase